MGSVGRRLRVDARMTPGTFSFVPNVPGQYPLYRAADFCGGGVNCGIQAATCRFRHDHTPASKSGDNVAPFVRATVVAIHVRHADLDPEYPGAMVLQRILYPRLNIRAKRFSQTKTDRSRFNDHDVPPFKVSLPDCFAWALGRGGSRLSLS